ncbi:HK97 gp10 family phage protein [Microbacterium maritypicum]
MADDFSEPYELAADLSEVPSEANRNIKKAIEVTARNVRDDWRQGAEVGRGDGYSERYASSIFYDIKFLGGSIEAEIGPELGRPGGSAGFLEDAPGGVQASPQHAGRDALEANEADFVRGLEIAITEAVIDKLGA